MINAKAKAATLAALCALLTPTAAQAMDTHTERSVARRAVEGIAYDLGGETSVFHCHEHGAHAACDVQVFGSFQTIRARILETEMPTVIHFQVRDLRVIHENVKPDPAP